MSPSSSTATERVVIPMYGDAEIHVFPLELWRYCNTHRTLIENSEVVIAEDSGRGIEVIVETNERGSIQIAVYVSGNRVYTEPVISPGDCVATLQRIYAKFFILDTQKDKEIADDDEDDEDEELDEIVTEEDDDEDEETVVELREMELQEAFTNFIEAVLYDDANDVGDDDFLEMLHDVLDVISLYRPVYAPRIVDGVLEEYPYNPEIDPENIK